MALANLPPIQPPRKWLEDPEITRGVQDLYFAVYQLFQRSGGGTDAIEVIDIQVNLNTTAITILESETEDASIGWPEQYLNAGDFSPAFRQSVQASNYVTIGNEILKLSNNVTVTLNAAPNDGERVRIKSATGKPYTVNGNGRLIDGRKAITYRNPYNFKELSYSVELDAWSVF